MPFEPLRTDEPLPPGKKPKPHDFESVIIAGCTGFVASAIITYVLAVWPFLVFQQLELLKYLIMCIGFGPLIAYLFGLITCRKFGLPGACGFIAGAMSVLVFLSLRMDQVFLSAAAGQLKQVQYPESFRILVPTIWMLGAVAIALIFTPRKEVSLKD